MKNEMKAEGTLLMALPNKDQLKNKADTETISLDDLYNNLKIYEPKLTRSSSTSQNPQNVAFVSSNSTNSTSSTNEVDNTAFGVSTPYSQGNTVNSTSVDNLSDAVICAFLASQPNSPQLTREDLEQIDHDDLEEMDLHWVIAMLTIRAKRFIKITGRNLDINGQKISFDRSKIECFNYYKNGHFARECRALKNQENKQIKYGRKTMPMENPTENALIAQDEIGGYDWSYQAEEEHPTNYALMALTSSGSSSSLDFEVDSCSRICIKAYATLKEQYDSLSSDYKKNYIPPKPDLMFIDEQVESESVDVVSNVTSSDVKTIKSKHESVGVKTKGVYSTVETKPVRKNGFSPQIIKDWNFNDESKVEFEPKVEVKIVRPSIKKIKFVKTAREKVENVATPKQNKHYPRGDQRNWNNLMSQRLGTTKDETSRILKTFITGIENQLDCKVKVIRCDNGTEFKNSVMNQFCDMKGIKREFSVVRTPKKNGVAERKNRTLIEATRTMLVDSKLPTTFWAEVVNTACYVQNRALVVKPHNKTLYELIRGRPPLIDFIKSFRCHVTILNTRDSLGKFDRKADEGFLSGNGPDWLFDIDSLTISMNYKPVVAEKQTNGIAGTKDNIVAGQAKKKKELEQEYILIPICTNDPLISQGPKDSAVDAGKKATEVDESRVSNNGGQDEQATRSEFEGLLQQERQTKHINSTNSFNFVVLPANTAGPSFANTASPSHINAAGTPASTNPFEEHPFERFSPFKNAFSLPYVPIVTLINDTGILGNAYDDQAVEEEVDMTNVVSSYIIPDVPLTKFLKVHPKD
nr:hypothetical protein [Tanacetum cinerariifolium]